MNREFSPEEKLLRLIKGKKTPNIDDKHANEKPQGIPDLSDNIVPVPVSSGADSIKDKSTLQSSAAAVNSDKSKLKIFLTKPKISIKPAYIIISIILISVSVALYFIFNFAGTKDEQELENIKKLIALISEAEQPGVPETADYATIKDKKPVKQDERNASFDDYQKLINAKPIFAPPVTNTGKAAVQEGLDLIDVSKDLRLVGTIPGDIPQAIIEDKKNNQTLFLTEGEIVNNIEVKSILTGKVILVYNEETITLSL